MHAHLHVFTCTNVHFALIFPVKSKSTENCFTSVQWPPSIIHFVIHSVLVCLKNEMHEFKTHSVLYRVIRAYYALNCNLNNTMQITFR